MTTETSSPGERDLVLERVIDAPRHAVWRCWSEPALLTQWFTPPPWKTIRAELDVRPGGKNFVMMRGPDGTEMPNHGIYLEVVPQEKLVLTDAFVSAWEPSPKPFMVAVLTFADAPSGGTRYRALVRHWTIEDRKQHEEMGFHKGWGVATDQLEALAKSLG